MIRHILVGIDGSAPARKAARFAHDLALQTGARLTLIYVLEPPRLVPIGPLDAFAIGKGRSPADLEAARRLLDETAADLPRAEKDVEFGLPAEILLEQVRAREVDLLVVGAHGAGTGERLLLGSVSDRLVHHATCPVTVVR